MISIDFLQEILHTIRTNKLRTFLTGFSVAWGMLILIILLGAGNGLQNGVKEKEFSRGKVNSMWIVPLWTSMPYKGFPEGRRIEFHNDDYEALKKFKEITAITGMNNEETWEGKSVMHYKENYGVFEMCSCHPDMAIADQVTILQGRFINWIDIDQVRKTAVISKIVKEALFKNEDPLGKYITVRGVPFKVIGVYQDASELNNRRVYLPITTRQHVFNGGDKLTLIGITLIDMTVNQIENFMTRLREYFAEKYKFDPRDMRAVLVNDVFKRYKQQMDLFFTINIIVWVVGIMTIIAGIMGISNIMIITVKERTHEIGIRKALGATPASIVSQIISETILITGVAGFLGMSMGVFLLDFAAKNIPAFDYFKNPEVNVWIILSAAAVIVISGVLAGLAPALHAAGIRPIVALRDEETPGECAKNTLFNWDFLQEIILTLEKNPLRTLLTAFGVFWGIFMLVLLLGGGQGLKTGALQMFENSATNSIWLHPERSTIPYKGLPRNREYSFTTEDVAAIKDRVKGINHLVSDAWQFRIITRGTQKLNSPVIGTFPEFIQVQAVSMPLGRFINQIDMEQKRKVVVIGKKVHLTLFKNNEDPIGKYIRVAGAEYQVVGVFHSLREGPRADGQNGWVFMPLSTIQQAFNLGNKVFELGIEAKPGASATRIGEEIKSLLKERHRIAPEDSLAVGEWNQEKKYLDLIYLHAAIAVLIWIIGIGTLLSGIIGVSNIMLFTVKARTHEIGIRRVLGATPLSVITQILMESLLLTSSAGIFGLALGILVLSKLYGIEAPMFRNPDISVMAALSSLGIIIVSGMAAGLLPAWRAISLKPIEAIRDIT